MKRFAATATLLLTLAATGACRERASQNVAKNENGQATTAESSMTPEQLGQIGAKIKKDPSKMDEILASYGLDEKRFESEIRKTTQSPDASKRYAAAYKTASK